MQKLKVGDQIKVVAGKDKGKSAKITKMFPAKQKVLVEGINKYKRHIKRQNDQNPGGIVEVERPLNWAKVQIICPSCKKPTRIGFKTTKTSKVRICKKCAAQLS
jgi:large subunit ribosomal protein L24